MNTRNLCTFAHTSRVSRIGIVRGFAAGWRESTSGRRTRQRTFLRGCTRCSRPSLPAGDRAAGERRQERFVGMYMKTDFMWAREHGARICLNMSQHSSSQCSQCSQMFTQSHNTNTNVSMLFTMFTNVSMFTTQSHNPRLAWALACSHNTAVSHNTAQRRAQSCLSASGLTVAAKWPLVLAPLGFGGEPWCLGTAGGARKEELSGSPPGAPACSQHNRQRQNSSVE